MAKHIEQEFCTYNIIGYRSKHSSQAEPCGVRGNVGLGVSKHESGLMFAYPSLLGWLLVIGLQ